MKNYSVYLKEVIETERTINKVKSDRSIGELTSHFLRLLRSGSETRVFLSIREEAPQEISYYNPREEVSSLMDIEYKKAQVIMEFQKRHRYF